MKVNDVKVGEAMVTLSSDELGFLGNAINEALGAISEWEFRTRTGETPKRAREMLSELRNILEKTDKQS
jgi:hypothetical protein